MVLARFSGAEVQAAAAPEEAAPAAAARAEQSPALAEPAAALAAAATASAPAQRQRISPAARVRARQLGIDPAQVTGSGVGGAVTLEDIA
jgi:pyruvate dehydrogenase E2 component (dihydrolipoamide acetyltransferase)